MWASSRFEPPRDCWRVFGLTDISSMTPKRRPIEGKVAVWDGLAQPRFRVLALSAVR